MNANTALKINDAVAQAIECGESIEDVFGQVERAAMHAFAEKQKRERAAFLHRIEQARR